MCSTYTCALSIKKDYFCPPRTNFCPVGGNITPTENMYYTSTKNKTQDAKHSVLLATPSCRVSKRNACGNDKLSWLLLQTSMYSLSDPGNMGWTTWNPHLALGKR